MIVHHRIAAGLLDRDQHRVVGPQGSGGFNGADDSQQQRRHYEGGLDSRRTRLGCVPGPLAAIHCSRTSVAAVSVAGMPGQGASGEKGWFAVIRMNMRLGPGRPTVAHDSLQVIGVSSSHSQLRGKLAGKVNGGPKLVALCIACCMPLVLSGYVRAYPAPIRAVAASPADLDASIPKSAIPVAIRTRSGAISANSAATLPL